MQQQQSDEEQSQTQHTIPTTINTKTDHKVTSTTSHPAQQYASMFQTLTHHHNANQHDAFAANLHFHHQQQQQPLHHDYPPFDYHPSHHHFASSPSRYSVSASVPDFKGTVEDLAVITNFKRFKRKGSTSKYKGVFYVKKEKKFRAQICLKGKKKYVGTFKNDRDAALARDQRIREMFGEVDELLNFPKSGLNEDGKSEVEVNVDDEEDEPETEDKANVIFNHQNDPHFFDAPHANQNRRAGNHQGMLNRFGSSASTLFPTYVNTGENPHQNNSQNNAEQSYSNSNQYLFQQGIGNMNVNNYMMQQMQSYNDPNAGLNMYTNSFLNPDMFTLHQHHYGSIDDNVANNARPVSIHNNATNVSIINNNNNIHGLGSYEAPVKRKRSKSEDGSFDVNHQQGHIEEE